MIALSKKTKNQIAREVRKENAAKGRASARLANRLQNERDFMAADIRRKAANAPAGSMGAALR